MEKMEDCETHDSFQCELEAYVRKQRARGLQPRLCFRSQVPEATAHPKRGHLGPRPLVLAQGLVPSRFPAPYGKLRPSQSQVHRWPAIGHSAQRRGFLNSPQRFHQPLASTWLPRPCSGVESWGCTGAQGLQGSTQPCWEEGCDLGGESQKQEQEQEQVEPKAEPQEEGEPPKKRRRAKADSPRRHSRKRDLAKEEKQSRRKKKEPERDLWDEAILGGDC